MFVTAHHQLLPRPAEVERLRPARKERDSRKAIARFIEIWAAYVPTIYALAKRLLILRETNEAAAAAWQDRLDSLRSGPCTFLVRRLEKQGWLNQDWELDAAIDFFWTLISIQTWESLVIERGWTQEQYATRLKHVVRASLIASAAHS